VLAGLVSSFICLFSVQLHMLEFCYQIIVIVAIDFENCGSSGCRHLVSNDRKGHAI